MTNYKLLVFNEDYVDEHSVPALACFNQEEYESWFNTKITNLDGDSKLYARLGNSGECFEEDYKEYTFAKELVEANIVKVFDVDENFYKYFELANLNRLSLCNVFEIEDYD